MRPLTGTIDTTREGRHRVRLTLPARGRVTFDTFDTRDEAEHARAVALDVFKAETEAETWTVYTWGERWLNARDINKTVRDPDSDWSRWNNHIKKDPIAKIGLRSLRRKHVKAWLERVRGRVARQTALNCLNVLRGLLGAAMDDEIIKINPAKDIRLPKEKRTEDPWTFANPDEQTALLNAARALSTRSGYTADSIAEYYIVAFAMGTGLREGELCALRLADVHTEGDDPHVVVRYGSAPDIPTKGGKIRRVPLFGIALAAAREWLQLLPRWVHGGNPRGLFFAGKRSSFRDEAHVIRWELWQWVKKTAGITRNFRWHDLRHTAGSSLVSGWWGRVWTLQEVRDFLGHESVTTTERYAHLGATALKLAAAETRKAVEWQGSNGFGARSTSQANVGSGQVPKMPAGMDSSASGNPQPPAPIALRTNSARETSHVVGTCFTPATIQAASIPHTSTSEPISRICGTGIHAEEGPGAFEMDGRNSTKTRSGRSGPAPGKAPPTASLPGTSGSQSGPSRTSSSESCGVTSLDDSIGLKRPRLVSDVAVIQPESSMISSGATCRNRTDDLRFTKTQENPRSLAGIRDCGQLKAISLRYLRAVAEGDEDVASALAAKLGALCFANHAFATQIAESIATAGAEVHLLDEAVSS